MVASVPTMCVKQVPSAVVSESRVAQMLRWGVGGHPDPDLPAGGHERDTMDITERDRIP
jgi:hypothetical protein